MRKQNYPAIPATRGLKCRCIKGGACSTIGIYPATMVLQPCYKMEKSPYRTSKWQKCR